MLSENLVSMQSSAIDSPAGGVEDLGVRESLGD